MTKKLIKVYIQNLKNIRDAKQGKVPNQTMTKMNNVINLYEDRKISAIHNSGKFHKWDDNRQCQGKGKRNKAI